MPSPGLAEDGYVAGYPREALPAAPGSTIELSSVSPQGSRLQVALNADAGGGAPALVRFYRQHLTELGFEEIEVQQAGGGSAPVTYGFTRSSESATLTVQTGDRVTYSLFAILRGDQTS